MDLKIKENPKKHDLSHIRTEVLYELCAISQHIEKKYKGIWSKDQLHTAIWDGVDDFLEKLSMVEFK